MGKSREIRFETTQTQSIHKERLKQNGDNER